MTQQTNLIDPAADAYAIECTSQPPALLDEVERETAATAEHPVMLSGRCVGRLLKILTATVRPTLAVDVGTFTGYSALSIAEGLPDNGKVVSLELDAKQAAIAQGHFDRSPFGSRIELRVGPAMDNLRSFQPNEIGLAFIDADKLQYWDYYDTIVERLAPGGLIVVDNTLFFGSVLAHDKPGMSPFMRHHGRVLDEFNRRVQADPRTESCMLTVRDGVTLIRRC